MRRAYVLIGLAASGLALRFLTPPSFPGSGSITGVELNAYVLNALLSNSAIEPLATPCALPLTAAG